MTEGTSGAYTAENSLVDYILGITYEIWEEGQIDLINQYYDADTVVYGLDGITRGASGAIAGTRQMLRSFPDRQLLADDVIGAGDCRKGYSSHRIISPMTNSGDTVFGPATHRKVRIMNVADCVIEDAVITQEWLVRDTLALVKQLGFDPRSCAHVMGELQSEELRQWFIEEHTRLKGGGDSQPSASAGGIDQSALLRAQWVDGNAAVLNKAYPHYAVMHRTPIDILSGAPSIARHYETLRSAFAVTNVSLDHICEQQASPDVTNVALRWSLSGEHQGNYMGVKATGKPVYIMGVTHQRMVAGAIAVQWTVFDSLAVMAQLVTT